MDEDQERPQNQLAQTELLQREGHRDPRRRPSGTRSDDRSASGREEAPNVGRRFVSLLGELDGAYVVRLGAFRALCGVELHALTFIE